MSGRFVFGCCSMLRDFGSLYQISNRLRPVAVFIRKHAKQLVLKGSGKKRK